MLDEGAAEPSARGNGRGRGRGRGGSVPGLGFRAAAQNAVRYDYGTPLQSGQQSPTEQVSTPDERDDDIVLEAHPKYVHTLKPHLEQQELPQRYRPQDEAGPSIMLPPSVSNLYARSPSNLVAMERAQRAMEGQVAGLIPTGPKSAHVHRMYGTLDAVHVRNRNRQHQQQQQQYPLPVSTPNSDKKKGGKFQRPADNSVDDPCMAGIPRPTLRKDVPSKYNFLGKSAGGNLQLPVKFEKASGEWRDGAWIRSADGKELATEESIQGAAQTIGNVTDPFDRANGAGLGFRPANAQKTAPAPLEDDLWAMEREQHDEESDPIAALLKLHPGSMEMQEEGLENDEGFGYYQGSMGVMQIAPASGRNQSGGIEADSVSRNDLLVDEADQAQIDENLSADEDVILVPQAHSTEGTSQIVESDSEEERQLDSIIKKNKQGEERTFVVEQKEAEVGFFVDLTGDLEGSQSEATRYKYASTALMSEQVSKVAVDDMIVEESSAEEGVNMKQQQSRKGGKRARNAAKKSRRRARKGINADSEPLVAREGDSDLEWGSDGPPVQFRKKADQEIFVQGGPMQQLSLDVLSPPQSKEEEEEMLAIALVNSVGTSKKTSITLQSHKDAVMADYMENAMRNNDDNDTSEGEDVITEERDEKKVNQKTDLDTLLQFISGMDGQRKGREMTLEDIAIEKQLDEEDEWMTESGEEEEEGENQTFDAAVERAERRALPVESSEEEDDSDESDLSEDQRQTKDRKETWSSSDDSDKNDDEDDDFDRHFSWADADEDFIRRIDKFAHANGSILKGRDRKARNRLFKMIQTGTFDNVDEEDMNIDLDDPVLGLGALQPIKGGKKAKKTWGADHVFAEHLESQWQKDRAQKADNKRKRAAERAAAAEDPYHGTQIKKGTKKMAKKAARAERRANKQRGGHDLIDPDDDNGDGGGGGGNSRHATNLFELDKQIQLFLRDTTKTTLSLSPMDKRARAQVHLLANCYNLTSKSIGTGTKRFPTLIKNGRSGFNVNFAKVNSVLNGSRGGFGSGSKVKNRNEVKVKDRASGVGAHVPKNQEGAAVGFGADRIGQDNIGHKLLTMMGWSEGSGVGRTQGLAEPVGATIKVTKSGLGF